MEAFRTASTLARAGILLLQVLFKKYGQHNGLRKDIAFMLLYNYYELHLWKEASEEMRKLLRTMHIICALWKHLGNSN